MFSISFHLDSDESWFVRCRELNAEILLQETVEFVEAAELTGWQPNDSISIGRRPDNSSLLVTAQTILRENVGREFPLPPVSTFSDRLWEAWLSDRQCERVSNFL
jgi:hypothetical protein